MTRASPVKRAMVPHKPHAFVLTKPGFAIMVSLKCFIIFIPIFLFFSDGLDDSHNHLDLVFIFPRYENKK